MKKLLIIFFAAVAVTVQADPTPTNSVRIQDLTNAVTPLDGTELVPIVQNFGTRKSTVADFNYLAKTFAMAASNTLNIRIVNNAATAAAGYVSNNAANLATSNALATVRAGIGTMAGLSSNGLTVANISNAGNIATRGSNEFYLNSNPSNYQSAANVSVSISTTLAQILSGSVAGNFQVSNLNYSVGINTNLSVRDANSRYAVIDLARGSVQNITYTNTESEVFLLLTNVAAGQNVTVYFYNGDLTAATSKIFHVPANVLNYAGKLYVYQGVTNQLLDNFLLHGKTAVLNFTAFDSTNVVFSTSIER